MKLFQKNRSFTGNLLELPNPKIKNLNNYQFIKFKDSSQKYDSNDYANLETRQKAIDNHKDLQLRAIKIINGEQDPFSFRLLDEFEIFNYHNFLSTIQERTIESTTFAMFSEIREIQDEYLKFLYKLDLKNMIKYINVEDWGKIFINSMGNSNFTISTNFVSKILNHSKGFIEKYFKKENQINYKEVFEFDSEEIQVNRLNWTELQNLDLIIERENLYISLPERVNLSVFLKSKDKFERIKRAEAICFLEKEGKIAIKIRGNITYILKNNLKKSIDRPRSLVICTY